MKGRPKHRINFYIADDQHESLLARQQRLGVPIAEQIRRAIDEFLEKHGKLSPHKERSNENSEKRNQ